MGLHRLSKGPFKVVLLCAAAAIGLQFAASTETTRIGHWAMGVGWHPDARDALALHCGALDAAARDDCRTGLRREFGDDEQRALAIIRLHCTRYQNVWSAEVTAPAPEACRERFGGWLEG